MVKTEKFDHLHLVCLFTIPLKMRPSITDLELKNLKDSSGIFKKSPVTCSDYLEPRITMGVIKEGIYHILVKTLWPLKNVTTWENIYLVRVKSPISFRR